MFATPVHGGEYRPALSASFALIVSLMCVWLLPMASALAQDDGALTISGVVTANGKTVGEGIEVQFINPETGEVNCGSSRTTANGRFTVEADCALGTQYKVHLPVQVLTSESTYVAGPAPISVNFPDLADEQLEQLGITTTAATPEQQQATSILESGQLTFIVATVVISAALVILALAIMVNRHKSLKKQTEAMVLVAVIIAIIILGVTAKIGSDGLISVLAAIVGWGAARATNGGPPSPSTEPEEPEPEEPEPEEPKEVVSEGDRLEG